MHDLFSQPDTLSLILQHCETIQILSKVAQLNKTFNTHVMHSTSGKQIWLGLASNLTGHNAKEHISVNGNDFHSRLKLLVCPWLSIPRTLSLPIEPLMDPDDMSITLVNDDSIALWHDAKAVGIGNARQAIRKWKFTGNVSDLQPPNLPSRKIFQPITSPPQLQLSNQHDCRYLYQHIHKNALAIVEITAWDMEHRSGIYFFRNSNGKATKLLRHILVGINPAQTSMITRPMEMWMLTEERVLYFGPSCDMLHLSVEGRMDRALWAAGVGKVKAAMRFLQRIGVTDINTPCITGDMTLLHIAAMQNQIKAVQSLLKAKADPEARDDQQMTCTMIASSLEYPDMIRVLCDEGKANPNAMTYCNETALHIVGHQSNINQEFTKATVRALLDSLADPNAKDVKGQTPLFSVAILNTPCAAKLLCSRGADPMHRNAMGRTPLHALFEVCLKADTAAILVKKFKADVNAQDEDGTTPLMLAAHTRTSVNVRCLLNDLQANPLLRNRKGRDALWFAKNGTDAPAQARTVVRMIEESCMIWGKDQDV